MMSFRINSKYELSKKEMDEERVFDRSPYAVQTPFLYRFLSEETCEGLMTAFAVVFIATVFSALIWVGYSGFEMYLKEGRMKAIELQKLYYAKHMAETGGPEVFFKMLEEMQAARVAMGEEMNNVQAMLRFLVERDIGRGD